MPLKRRTEINIELTRTWLMHRPAAPCECAACAAQSEMVAPEAAVVLIDVNTRTLSDNGEGNQGYFVEYAEAGAAIKIESAAGQFILAAAVRSLEQRLSAEARAALRHPPEPTGTHRARISRSLYAKLHWLRHIIHPKSTRRTR